MHYSVPYLDASSLTNPWPDHSHLRVECFCQLGKLKPEGMQ